MLLPAEAQPLLAALLPHLSRPTYTRLVVLTAAAVVTTGRRTVANLLRTVGSLAPGHPSSYRRVLSAAEWSGLALGCALARFLLTHLVPDGPVDLVGDDTVDGHPGPKVYGKGRHRDAVRSSHAFTAWRYGHKWVVLAVLVKFPFASRRWALPVLVDLYRTPEVSRAEGVRHRTPAQLMCRLLRLLLTRFPGRAFVFAGDAGYGTHEVARFCHRHRRRLTLVSKLHPDANLFESPPPYAGNGRPRVKGRRVPKPRQAAATARRARLTVAWYGGGTRRVEAATGTGHWYKGGHGLVPIRWVFVKDATGTHRDEYLFTTDTSRTTAAVVGTLLRPLVDRNHVSRMPPVRRVGDDARPIPDDGRPGRPVPVRPVLGGGRGVPPAARGQAGRPGGVGWQGHGDVLRRPHRRPPAGVGRRGIPTRQDGRGYRRTPGQRPGVAAIRSSTGPVKLHKSS